MISKGSGSSKSHEMNLEIGVKILLSIYNRFVDRDDLDKSYLNEGADVSISALISLVNTSNRRQAETFEMSWRKNRSA